MKNSILTSDSKLGDLMVQYVYSCEDKLVEASCCMYSTSWPHLLYARTKYTVPIQKCKLDKP